MNRAENENQRDERRRDVRIGSGGSVLVHAGRPVTGRIVNLSTGGIGLDVADEDHALAVAEIVALELHLDRAESRWLAFRGRVLRVAGRRVAIAFVEVPVAFGQVMSRAIASAIDAAATTHVLLVDPDVERRDAFAALMRHADCVVAEASSPLEVVTLGSLSLTVAVMRLFAPRAE